MNISDSSPAFNLKVVIQETGIKPHTLRAWERRYGLPQPGRTSGGHRLYSQRDIEVVKWLMARQEEGLTISRAAELWLSLVSKGEDPLIVVSYQIEERPVYTEHAGTLHSILQEWVNSCLNFDETAAERVLAQAFAMYPVKMVCLEILQKGIAQIGDLWYENKASVQQEHFASALAMKRLHALLAATPIPNRIGRIMIAAPPHEEHAIPLLLLSLLLRHRGWRVIYLGANVPTSRLEATVDLIKPDLVVLAAQQLSTVASLLEVAQVLHKKEVRVAYGGLILNRAPSLRQRIPGYFLGENLEDAVQTISQIMTFNPPMPAPEPTPKVYERALSHYVNRYPLIEMDAWQEISTHGIPYAYVSDTNMRLSGAIIAALSLGEIKSINTEINWTHQLVRNYGISSDWQIEYFTAYCRAVDKHLNGNGLVIVECLNDVISSMVHSPVI
ncbi:MAG: MerR family transcriptional regulator [Chloroflexi bacterium]|nr:MerR family transcriptional regulator [Chloroflexota bacterium]